MKAASRSTIAIFIVDLYFWPGISDNVHCAKFKVDYHGI